MNYKFGSHKIIEFSKAKSFFAKIKKKKKIIQCHGVFDLVHPGHIRHFAHCRSKAEILIVSLTSDAFINKGNYRPFVPEKMRAQNLAVLEMVDFVIIDKNKNPLKPDRRHMHHILLKKNGLIKTNILLITPLIFSVILLNFANMHTIIVIILNFIFYLSLLNIIKK